MAARLGEGQVEGIGGRYDAEQQEQHYVQGHEGVAGALATTNPPAPGAALGSHRDGQADGAAQCRGLRLGDDLEAGTLGVVRDLRPETSQLGREALARCQVRQDGAGPYAVHVPRGL